MFEPRKCPECDTELNMTYPGRYECPKCGGTYYESDFVENEGILDKPFIKSAIEEMNKVMDKTDRYEDAEDWHYNADNILCNVLKELGLIKLVEAWEKVEKWYA